MLHDVNTLPILGGLVRNILDTALEKDPGRAIIGPARKDALEIALCFPPFPHLVRFMAPRKSSMETWKRLRPWNPGAVESRYVVPALDETFSVMAGCLDGNDGCGGCASFRAENFAAVDCAAVGIGLGTACNVGSPLGRWPHRRGSQACIVQW